jgi:cobaltochelatase CobT
VNAPATLAEAAREARRQERIEALCAASARAIAREHELHYRGGRLHRGALPLPVWAPHLHPPKSGTDFDVFRGAADAAALRLLLSDTALHERLRPAHPIERLIFDVLEQLRVESLAPARWPGVHHNIARAFRAWSDAFHAAGHNATARGLLLYTIVQMARTRLTGEEAIEPDEGLLEAARASLGPVLGRELAALKRHAGDQAAYAEPALAIAKHIAQMLASADEEDCGNAERADAQDDERSAFNFWIAQAPTTGETGAPLAPAGESAVLAGAAGVYRIFTTDYDREAAAATLARAPQLAAWREELDAAAAAARLHIPQLAREIRARLALPAFDGHDSALEEGRIDGRRLAQLIASPTERRLFRDERIRPRAEGLVTLLVDCSGSMRELAPKVALLVDALARALELAGLACEVLGYTTAAWNGGRAQRDWMRTGRPRHPGRLNERLHVVFKPPETPWRRARCSIAALLKPDLYRESLDGEAVAWALQRQAERLASEPEERQWLLVISDGSPMDSATHLANDVHYLDHHLRDVVERHENGGARIAGLGVALDLSPYYRTSHVLDLAEGVGMGVTREVLALLARCGRK